MNLSSCEGPIENTVFILAIVSFFIAIVSGFQVFRNEKEVKGKELVGSEILGGFHPIFTSKYLNTVGKKWRPFFISSVFLLVTFIIVSNKYGFCA